MYLVTNHSTDLSYIVSIDELYNTLLRICNDEELSYEVTSWAEIACLEEERETDFFTVFVFGDE